MRKAVLALFAAQLEARSTINLTRKSVPPAVNPSCVIAFNTDPVRLNHHLYRNQGALEEFGLRSRKYLSTDHRSPNQFPPAVC